VFISSRIQNPTPLIVFPKNDIFEISSLEGVQEGIEESVEEGII